MKLTYQEVKKAAEKKESWSYQESTITEDSHRTVREIGVCFGKWNWHWFEEVTFHFEDKPDSTYFDFTHSYSQVNGKTKKGLRHMMKIEERISRVLDPSIEKLFTL